MRNTLIATLITGALLSFNVQAIDLLQVYKEALVNDPVYASARYTLTAGQERITQGRAGLLPTLAIGGSRNQVRGEADFVGEPFPRSRDSDSKGYTVSLSQPLFRWENWQQYQQGKLSVAASEAQFAQAHQDLIVRVSQAYFDVLTAQDALASVQAQKTAITEQLASAKRNFEVGTATITDTHEAQARFDLAIAQEFAAESDLEVKRAALQQIIGKPAGELATLRPGVQLTSPQPAQLDKWVESAELQNYTVIGQQLAREIAQREISKNRAGHLPTVDLVASRNHNDQSGIIQNTSANVSDTNTIGVQWNIPLFSGFAVTSRVREAIALEEKARADLENARRSAAQAARQSYLGVNSGLAQVKALEAAEVSSQSSLDANRLGYQVGVRINIDVLNAQQQLYLTRRDLAKARYDTLMNGLKLKSAAGTLKEEDLSQVNALLTSGQTGGSMLNAADAKPVAYAMPPSQVQRGTTPAENKPSGAAAEVSDMVNAWANAWNAQDAKAYLDFYSDDFKPAGGQSRTAWVAQRRARIDGAKQIKVTVDAPRITMEGNTVTVKFRQVYVSDKLRATDSKTLVLAKENGNWKIRQEVVGR